MSATWSPPRLPFNLDADLINLEASASGLTRPVKVLKFLEAPALTTSEGGYAASGRRPQLCLRPVRKSDMHRVSGRLFLSVQAALASIADHLIR